jgi:hypothetical protein
MDGLSSSTTEAKREAVKGEGESRQRLTKRKRGNLKVDIAKSWERGFQLSAFFQLARQ